MKMQDVKKNKSKIRKNNKRRTIKGGHNFQNFIGKLLQNLLKLLHEYTQKSNQFQFISFIEEIICISSYNIDVIIDYMKNSNLTNRIVSQKIQEYIEEKPFQNIALAILNTEDLSLLKSFFDKFQQDEKLNNSFMKNFRDFLIMNDQSRQSYGGQGTVHSESLNDIQTQTVKNLQSSTCRNSDKFDNLTNKVTTLIFDAISKNQLNTVLNSIDSNTNLIAFFNNDETSYLLAQYIFDTHFDEDIINKIQMFVDSEKENIETIAHIFANKIDKEFLIMIIETSTQEFQNKLQTDESLMIYIEDGINHVTNNVKLGWGAVTSFWNNIEWDKGVSENIEDSILILKTRIDYLTEKLKKLQYEILQGKQKNKISSSITHNRGGNNEYNQEIISIIMKFVDSILQKVEEYTLQLQQSATEANCKRHDPTKTVSYNNNFVSFYNNLATDYLHFIDIVINFIRDSELFERIQDQKLKEHFEKNPLNNIWAEILRTHFSLFIKVIESLNENKELSKLFVDDFYNTMLIINNNNQHGGQEIRTLACKFQNMIINSYHNRKNRKQMKGMKGAGTFSFMSKKPSDQEVIKMNRNFIQNQTYDTKYKGISNVVKLVVTSLLNKYSNLQNLFIVLAKNKEIIQVLKEGNIIEEITKYLFHNLIDTDKLNILNDFTYREKDCMTKMLQALPNEKQFLNETLNTKMKDNLENKKSVIPVKMTTALRTVVKTGKLIKLLKLPKESELFLEKLQNLMNELYPQGQSSQQYVLNDISE